tara:strand:- start:1679 stop:2254 length:576 start_codon:yes stop_codon:yes gene_type:complete
MLQQKKLDDFFNIKYRNNKNNKNMNSTPNNTPDYGSFNSTGIINKINSFQLNDTIQNKIPKYILRFDGASRGNPGRSGAGAVLYKNDKEIWSVSRNLGIQTNNYAECFAMTLGIDRAFELGIKNLIVEGDSMLIINQLKGKWKIKNKDLKNLHLSIVEKIRHFDNITYKHIYRKYNSRADELANMGITQGL